MAVPKFNPKEEGPEYLYNRLVAHLEELIRNDELKAGTRLPGEREFAKRFGVSIGTARKATQILRERGRLKTLPAKGHYVVPIPPDQSPEKNGDTTTTEDQT
jgi:GntR family transcriptional regulator